MSDRRRSAARTVVVLAAVAAFAFACGSSQDSQFGDPTVDMEAGVAPAPTGTFKPGDAGLPDGAVCKKQTCASEKANCGPISDGCGGVLQCGTCATGETCGGGGKASQCGKPACTTKTCAEQGATCGPIGDGCGGLIASCGTCDGGICGGGGPSKCGAGGAGDGGACVKTKSTCAAGDCGPIADGCGGLIDCSPPAWPACPAGQSCGGGGTPSLCGAPPCVKKTCGTQNCGYIADGCGGIVTCWPAPPAPPVCGPGESCGGAGVPNTCGTPATCTGLCTQQVTCPGGGTTSIEGYVTSPNGVLPVPNAVVYVPNAPVAPFAAGVACETCATASGSPLVSTTTDANGHFILPNMPVSAPGKVTDIPVVVQLGRWRKQFTIVTNACVNNLVPSVGMAVPSKTAALPARQSEGDIPLTAISTGEVDGLECVFRKMGVADTEFTDAAGTGRIRLYQDNGARISVGSPAASALYTPAADNVSGNVNGATNASPIVISTTTPHGLATGVVATIASVKGNTAANGSWIITVVDATHFSLNSSTGSSAYTSGGTWSGCAGATCANEIDKYDAVIFGCVGSEVTKAARALQNVKAYANKGGRVFGTHFSYVWLNSPTTWGSTANKFAPSTASWDNLSAPGSMSAIVDTSFPKGVLFSEWLVAPVAPTSVTFPPPYSPLNALYTSSPPSVALTEPRKDIEPAAANLATSGIIAPAQRWMYSTKDDGKVCAGGATCESGVCNAGHCAGSVVFDPVNDPAAQDAPMHYTFNTDTTKPAAAQCGRVLYSDFHVTVGTTKNVTFPGECDANPLTSQEKVLAYFLFDLASCVSSSGPPACVKKTCMSQGLGCGLAGDGCGGQLDCGPCPPGLSCGGGGVPSQCGAPACTPLKCVAGQCGKLGDGCGGTLDCGNCAVGTTCGGGGPNICGVAACMPQACPMPAPGSVCGPVANGCGAVNNCPCPPGTPCVNGTCGAPMCTPRTCAQAGANCGQIADGCGGIQMCGNCIAPQTCGGGGTANLCGGGVN